MGILFGKIVLSSSLTAGIIIALILPIHTRDSFETSTTTPLHVDTYTPTPLLALAKDTSVSLSATSTSLTATTSTATTLRHTTKNATTSVFTVPFYSQFGDITSKTWQKVGCGVASLAMIVGYYTHEYVSVDTLLAQGIKNGAYDNTAGWTYAGLIGLSHRYGLEGVTRDYRSSSMEAALSKLKASLKTGPVMASVHYTFTPSNPIPHLVVVTGITDDKVYYNDPAEQSGHHSISVTKFISSWKKRYIEFSSV